MVMTMSEVLSLKVITPEREYIYENCDSVKIPVSDNRKGNGGGSYGIHKGHANAIFSISEGKVSAVKNGEAIVKGIISSGFSSVENNIVTVIADGFKVI